MLTWDEESYQYSDKSCFILHQVHFCMWNKLLMADYVHYYNGKLHWKCLRDAASTMQSGQHYIVNVKNDRLEWKKKTSHNRHLY